AFYMKESVTASDGHVYSPRLMKRRRVIMKRPILLVVFGAAFAAFAFQVQTRPQQRGQPTQPASTQPGQRGPNADPYANNAAPGATQFPLAAPAGKDSNALQVAPTGAVNQ